METASPTVFDPYHKWLGIRGFRNAPNHYRLLGIDLFESDEEVIRDAAARQLTHLKTYRVGAQRELCGRIIDEVTQARSMLLDHERKTAYDRELKLKCATSGPLVVEATNGLSLIADRDTVGLDELPGIIGPLDEVAQCARPRVRVGRGEWLAANKWWSVTAVGSRTPCRASSAPAVGRGCGSRA